MSSVRATSGYVQTYNPSEQYGYVTEKKNIAQIVGKGYGDFWRFKGRYRVVKGSRGSKKSATTSIDILYKMMKYPLANTLILRRYFNTHRDSTFAQLKWAANILGVSHLWDFKESRLEIIYRPTGQKIMFRGLDDPMSITSITVDVGVLCWVWIEEAFQIMDERSFDQIDMSIRGEVPTGYYKQFTFTFNPWSEKHWLKGRFYDVGPNDDILAITTTYRCNEHLDEADLRRFAEMSPRRFKIEGDGEWGISEGLIYENWEERDFDYREIARNKLFVSKFGLDFGYTTDPSGFIALLISQELKQIYIFDEFYKRGMSNEEIANTIKYMGYAKEVVVADSAEPKSISRLKTLGINRVKKAAKGSDSVRFGIAKIQEYKIFVHPSCVNTVVELSNYVWQSKDGQVFNKPIGDFNHLMDALRYAVEDVGNDSFSF